MCATRACPCFTAGLPCTPSCHGGKTSRKCERVAPPTPQPTVALSTPIGDDSDDSDVGEVLDTQSVCSVATCEAGSDDNDSEGGEDDLCAGLGEIPDHVW